MERMPNNRRRGIAKCTKHPDRIAKSSINNDYLRTPTFFCQERLDNGELRSHSDHITRMC